jgi:hypothetical protein
VPALRNTHPAHCGGRPRSALLSQLPALIRTGGCSSDLPDMLFGRKRLVRLPDSRRMLSFASPKCMKMQGVPNGTPIAISIAPVMYGSQLNAWQARAAPGTRHEQPPTSGPQEGQADREACSRSGGTTTAFTLLGGQ